LDRSQNVHTAGLDRNAISIGDVLFLEELTSREVIPMGTILLIILILLLVGAFPSWPHSRGWGYYPSSGIGILLVILIVLLAMGRI
jgi:hypothetical protein